MNDVDSRWRFGAHCKETKFWEFPSRKVQSLNNMADNDAYRSHWAHMRLPIHPYALSPWKLPPPGYVADDTMPWTRWMTPRDVRAPVNFLPSTILHFQCGVNLLSRYYPNWPGQDLTAYSPATREGSLRSATEAPPTPVATGEEEIETADLKSLEDFAASFKARRIKLGYTQTNVGK